MRMIRADYRPYEYPILNWLYGIGPIGGDVLLLSKVPTITLLSFADGGVDTVEPLYEVLTRRRQWGLAPYVGPPFVYVWYIAVNGDGEKIAQTESWRHYKL